VKGSGSTRTTSSQCKATPTARPNRTRRREILAGLLFSLFQYKDDQRTFTSEQRRILWNSEERKLCRICKKEVTWNDLSIDHIKAYTRGGKTDLANAQLTHGSCNSRKGASETHGARRAARRKATTRLAIRR
jgi:5-methylcytosine-specific restriction endonuclease McrA